MTDDDMCADRKAPVVFLGYVDIECVYLLFNVGFVDYAGLLIEGDIAEAI